MEAHPCTKKEVWVKLIAVRCVYLKTSKLIIANANRIACIHKSAITVFSHILSIGN